MGAGGERQFGSEETDFNTKKGAMLHGPTPEISSWLARPSLGAPRQPVPASYSDRICFAAQVEKGRAFEKHDTFWED